jgi:hypothetical protein
MSERFACLLLFVFVAGCHGEPKTLEPRTPPPRGAAPVTLPPTPVPDGYGRVILNGSDGPMKITARADTTFVPPGHPVPPNRTGDLCTTPCIADLPVGRYELYMTSADGSYAHGDTDMLDVTEGVTHYERAPGKFVQPKWIPVLPTLVVAVGVAAALGGGALLTGKDDSHGCVCLIPGQSAGHRRLLMAAADSAAAGAAGVVLQMRREEEQRQSMMH